MQAWLLLWTLCTFLASLNIFLFSLLFNFFAFILFSHGPGHGFHVKSFGSSGVPNNKKKIDFWKLILIDQKEKKNLMWKEFFLCILNIPTHHKTSILFCYEDGAREGRGERGGCSSSWYWSSWLEPFQCLYIITKKEKKKKKKERKPWPVLCSWQ